MLRLAFDFIITWRETRTRPNAYLAPKWRGVVTQVIRLLHLGETIMQQSVCTISICK